MHIRRWHFRTFRTANWDFFFVCLKVGNNYIYSYRGPPSNRLPEDNLKNHSQPFCTACNSPDCRWCSLKGPEKAITSIFFKLKFQCGCQNKERFHQLPKWWNKGADLNVWVAGCLDGIPLLRPSDKTRVWDAGSSVMSHQCVGDPLQAKARSRKTQATGEERSKIHKTRQQLLSRHHSNQKPTVWSHLSLP